MNMLKAAWTVTGNLIWVGEPDPEYTRTWSYTSRDYEADGNKRGALFAQKQLMAMAYANQLQDRGFNWVDLQYVWV